MSLSNAVIRNTKAGDKVKRMFDGGGLSLKVSPKGGKWWRLKYRVDGKEKRLSLCHRVSIPMDGLTTALPIFLSGKK